MPILDRYRQLGRRPGFQPDDAQRRAVQRLSALEQRLIDYDRTAAVASGQRPEGLYLWGSVGRGKTLLMDLFFDELATPRKLRMHFHRFMQRVHRDLFQLSGHRNPLQRVAQGIASEADVLCFDEFFVSDIADAMLLGQLTEALFQRGVVLIATSNQHPDRLYRDGVNRERFMPAITQLKAHNQIFQLDGGSDHRLRPLQQRQTLMTPASPATEKQLRQIFFDCSQSQPLPVSPVTIERRTIACKGQHQGVAWFDFGELCDGPRSHNDYIGLAKRFHTVLISHVPALGGGPQQARIARGTEDVGANSTGNRVLFNDDRSRRFISLIDEFYDRSVNIYASTEKPLPQLYAGGHLAFEFERTRSRLIEMQSDDYLQRRHRPE